MTIDKNYGPFYVRARSIKVHLKHGFATLRCEVQVGKTPLGRGYKFRPQWYVKYDGNPCFMGPWNRHSIRQYFV